MDPKVSAALVEGTAKAERAVPVERAATLERAAKLERAVPRELAWLATPAFARGRGILRRACVVYFQPTAPTSRSE